MGLHVLYLCIVLDELGPALANQVNWVRALARTPWVDRVTVLTPRLGTADLPDNVTVVVTDTRGWARHRVRKVRRFRAALREVDLASVDLAIVAMGGGPYPLLLQPAKLRHRFPLVQWKADPTITRATRLYVRWCDDLVVTATPGSLPIDSPKVRAIGHGVDTALFRPPEPRPAAPFARDLVVVGRIAPVKGIDVALRALGAHRDRFGTAPTLDVIGRAGRGAVEHERELHDLVARLGLEDQVRFLGAVPYAEMPARLGDYGAYLQLGEGALDKAVLEAMAVGLPVVTSNPRTIEALPPELAARVRVPADDAAAQAEHIHQTIRLEPGERRALGDALRAVVVDGHDLQTLFTRVIAACADVGLDVRTPMDAAGRDRP